MIFTVTSAFIGFACVKNIMTEAINFFLTGEVEDIAQGSPFSLLATTPPPSPSFRSQGSEPLLESHRIVRRVFESPINVHLHAN